MMEQIKRYVKLMTVDKLLELRRYINSNEFHEIYYKKYQSEEILKLKKSKAEKAARQERKKKLETDVFPYLKEYCKLWIMPGDIVKFEGSNRGGIREVIKITDHTVIGEVVISLNGGVRLGGYFSENSFEKLNGVYKSDLANETDGSKCWFNRKSIINFIKSKHNES